jgi:hypothetical protein
VILEQRLDQRACPPAPMIPVLPDNLLQRQRRLYPQQQLVERRARGGWDGRPAGSALDATTLAR